MSQDAIDHRIAGQRDAECFLLSLRTMLGDGDELSRFLLLKMQGQPSEWVRGFCRVIQKTLERGPR